MNPDIPVKDDPCGGFVSLGPLKHREYMAPPLPVHGEENPVSCLGLNQAPQGHTRLGVAKGGSN